MMRLLQIEETGPPNPLDRFERIAQSRDWFVDRAAEDEVNMIAAAAWGDLNICLNWREDIEGLHISSSYDFRVQPNRREEVCRLLSLINEQLYFGHFDLWREDGSVLFRNGLALTGGAPVTDAQCEGLMQLAVEICERYYPTFQFVIWAGKTAEQAIEASLFETVGEA